MFRPPAYDPQQATVEQQQRSNSQYTSNFSQLEMQPFVIQPIGDTTYDQETTNFNPVPFAAQPVEQCTRERNPGHPVSIAVLTQIGQIQLCDLDSLLGTKAPPLEAIKSKDNKLNVQRENRDPVFEPAPSDSIFQRSDGRPHSGGPIRWAFEGGILKCVDFEVKDEHDVAVKSEPTDLDLKKRKKKRKPQKKQSNQQEFYCDICKRKCASMGGLKQHRRAHRPRQFYPCDDCGEVLSSSKTLEKHKRQHQAESHACNKCGKMLKSSAALKKHLKVHLREKAFKCDVCERSFKLAETLAVHYEIHDIDKPLECKDCLKRFARVEGLEVHERVHAKENKTSSGTVADFKTEQQKMDACDGEDRTAKQGQVEASGEDQDEAMGQKERDVDDHIVDEDQQHLSSNGDENEKDQDDYFPEKPFPKPRKKYKQKFHGQFLCDACGKVFNCSGHLQSHMTLHTGVKAYVCGTCGKAFRLPCSLKIHEVTHRSERPFVCETCGKMFKARMHLRNHKMMHSDERRYPCLLCSKSFRTSRQRGKHKRTHTGEKPFACSVCDQCFATSYTLQQHMRLHTGDKPYECQECGRRFIQSACLIAHKLSHKAKLAKEANKKLMSEGKKVNSGDKN